MAREKDNGFVRLEKLEGGFSDLYFSLEKRGYRSLGVYKKDGIYWDFLGHNSRCSLAIVNGYQGKYSCKLFSKHNRPRGQSLFVFEDGSLLRLLIDNFTIIPVEEVKLVWLYNYYRSLEISYLLQSLKGEIYYYVKLRDLKYLLDNLEYESSEIRLSTLWKHRQHIVSIQDKLTSYYNINFTSLKDLFLRINNKSETEKLL